MVNVRQIAEMGAYVQLLEYDNIEGMILLSELSRRRIRSIQKLIRVGKNEVVVVLRVDKEKGESSFFVGVMIVFFCYCYLDDDCGGFDMTLDMAKRQRSLQPLREYGISSRTTLQESISQ